MTLHALVVPAEHPLERDMVVLYDDAFAAAYRANKVPDAPASGARGEQADGQRPAPLADFSDAGFRPASAASTADSVQKEA